MTANEQYFTAQPSAQHQYQTFDFTLLGHTLTFTTDSGVFSKSTIDFGTRVMLEAADERTFVAGKLLDLGAGYGPVGIAMAKAWGREVDMVDVNERALELAQKNAEQNGVADLTHPFISSVYEQVTDQYAAILVNPPIRAGKDIVTAMLTLAPQYLLPGGKLIAVLQKKQGAPSAQKNMQAAFGNAKIIAKSKGYYIIESVRTDG